MCNIFHKMKHYIKNIYTAFFGLDFFPKTMFQGFSRHLQSLKS